MIRKIILRGLLMLIALPFFMGCSSPSANTAVSSTAKVDTGWRQLFNGKDLDGWKQVGPGSRYVKDGLTGSHGGMGLLYWTKEKFSNCVIRIVYKMEKSNSNSGFFIRIPIEPREPWMPVFYGYEVQIDNHPETSGEDEYHITGTLYSLTKPLAKPGKPGPEWNTMEITLDGPHTMLLLTVKKLQITPKATLPQPVNLILNLSVESGQMKVISACKITAIMMLYFLKK